MRGCRVFPETARGGSPCSPPRQPLENDSGAVPFSVSTTTPQRAWAAGVGESGGSSRNRRPGGFFVCSPAVPVAPGFFWNAQTRVGRAVHEITTRPSTRRTNPRVVARRAQSFAEGNRQGALPSRGRSTRRTMGEENVAARHSQTPGDQTDSERPVPRCLGEAVGSKRRSLKSSKRSAGQQVNYSTGAVRSSDAEAPRFDLISPVGLRRVAETCAEGAANSFTKPAPGPDRVNKNPYE